MTKISAVSEVEIQRDAFDLGDFNAQLRAAGAAYGAIVTFTGLVREHAEEELLALELEHYPGMTEQALQRIVAQARQRWVLGPVLVRHRVGRLLPGDDIVFVGVASAHRRSAFEAAQFIMDFLKRDAPFWKKEILQSGEHWVEQKQSDLAAAQSWRDGD